ncbi:MAG: hypothetical protein ISR64_03530 [Deltaproteobacteria bacterium]|nr:hypothetical protein [Deltaproteobacteria bacterium]
MEACIEDIRFNARSLGGIGTTLTFPEMDLTIDLGVCTPAALRTANVAFTHTHADHLSGVSAYLGVRRLFGMKDPRFLVPTASAPAFRDLVSCLGALQGRPFEAEVVDIEPGKDLPLGNKLFLHPFRVEHNIPSQGLAVYRRVEKLKDEYRDLGGPEIARRRQEPDSDLFRVAQYPLVAVTGDSMVSGMDLDDPLVKGAKVLFVECTFVDDQRTPDYAHLGGHAHLDELGPRLEPLGCAAFVFFHFSQIYKTADIERAIAERLPDSVAQRAHLLLPEEADRL